MKILNKRILAALFAFIMILGVLVGCNGNTSDDPDDTKEQETIPNGTADDAPSDVISLKSEHYTVTNDMFAYYFYKDFYDAVDYYYESYYYYQNLDPTIDLKKQAYGESNTWFDYFISMTFQNVNNYLLFAEAALDEGITLSDEDRATIEADIASLEDAAATGGMTTQEFLDYRFGKGLTLDTVRRCQELYLLGTKYYDDILASYSYDDDDYDKYFEENKSAFLYIDYREVVVRANYGENATTAEIKAALADAKAKAEYIAEAKNIDEYVERGVEYYKSINDTLDEPLTDTQIFNKVTNIVVQYSYRDTTSLGKWAFDDERKDGDIVMLDNGAGIYTVFYLQNAPYRADNKTKNIRIAGLMASDYENDMEKAKTAAQALLDKHKELGGDGEALKQACDELSVSGGGLRKEMDLGELEPIIEGWAFDDERKPGDCEMLVDDEVVYVVYFESDGEVSWKLTAHEALLSGDMNARYKEFFEAHEVLFNTANMNLLSGETVYTGMEKTDE